MTGDAAAFARLRAGLPALAADTEVILRADGDRPLALLRPAGAPPRAFVLGGDGAAAELRPQDDGGLPAAHLFGDPRRLADALRTEVGAVAEPRLVAWRPGRRAVVRVRRGDELLFVKFLDRSSWQRATATFAALADAPPPLVFARATLLLPDLCAYVAPAAPGSSLRDHLAARIAPPWPLVDAALAALARTPTAPSLPRHDFATARAAAVKMLRKAAPLAPRLDRLADRIAACTPPTPGRSGLVHGDLHDKQLFLADDTAHLIDLEGIGAGDPAFDLANLAEHLRLRALQQTGDDDGSADALLDRSPTVIDRLRWRACVRARLCGVYALRPRWAALTEQLLCEVERVLCDIE